LRPFLLARKGEFEALSPAAFLRGGIDQHGALGLAIAVSPAGQFTDAP
jgi:hypothetical protein